MPPPVEDLSDEESGDIPFRDAPETEADMPEGNVQPDAEGEDGGKAEDDEEEMDDGDYIVENIVEHDWLDDGTLKFFVKWKGYNALKDHTWEEEDNLMDGASEIVNEYYEKIGGRPERPAAQKQKSGRKRKSMGNSNPKTETSSPAAAAESKRRRKSGAPKDTKKEASPKSGETSESWLPKGSWEKEVKEVSNIAQSKDQSGLTAYLLFHNGNKIQVDVKLCYKKCPLKMLQFYENHLVFHGGSDDADEE